MNELLKKLKVNSEYAVLTKNGDIVIDLKSYDNFSKLFLRLSKDEDFDELTDASILNENNGSIQFENDDYLITLVSDFEADEYKITINEKEEKEEKDD